MEEQNNKNLENQESKEEIQETKTNTPKKPIPKMAIIIGALVVVVVAIAVVLAILLSGKDAGSNNNDDDNNDTPTHTHSFGEWKQPKLRPVPQKEVRKDTALAEKSKPLLSL